MEFKIENLKLKIPLFIFIINFTSLVFAEPNKPQEVNEPNLVRATGHLMLDAKIFPKTAFHDAIKTYSKTSNLAVLLMAGGASIGLHDQIDHRIADRFERHRTLPKGLDNFGDIAGNPGIHFAVTGIWYALAAHNKDDLNIQRSWIMMRALAVTNTTTLILKGAAHNHSPNGSDFAWPSGHTASSFCVAAVLDEFYGHKIGFPAYAFAGFVGYRMMDSGDHWASDVLFGGILGYIVGHTIAGENKQLQIAGFDVLPLISPDRDGTTTGITLAKDF